MREALAGLTVRGRAFGGAGITAVVCAIVLGQPGLFRVGILLVVLPLVTAFVVSRGRYQLALTRSVSAQVVHAGQPAQVALTLTNEGHVPTGSLLLEESLPYALGARPRFVMTGVRHSWSRRVSYQVRSELRGRYELGPMSLSVSDPFGLVELHRTFQDSALLTVTPKVVPLPAIPLGGVIDGSGDSRPRAFAGGSAEDVTVREYRRGDDPRLVHWRSSARTGELMVRREEQPWQARATLVLDNRWSAHRGSGAASSFEAAVSSAASIAFHLSSRGFMVRLATTGGETASGSPWHTGAGANTLLESLAVIDYADSEAIDTSWLGVGTGGLTVAVWGALKESESAVLRRIRHHAGAALAVALDVALWWPEAEERRSTRRPIPAPVLLAQQGWRSAVMAPAGGIETAWHDLGATRTIATGAAR